MNRYWHLPLALLGLWAALLLVLSAQSPIRWADVRGWYAQQGDQTSYRWTGDRLVVPIWRSSAPIDIQLTLAAPRWPGRAPPHVALLADTQPLAAFDVPELPTSYHAELPPGTAALVLRSTADRSPFGDHRYLGVQVVELRAYPLGFSPRLVAAALLATALLGLAALLGAWCAAHGLGPQAALFVLALALRLAALWRSPIALGPAEAVSLADAWHLLATGRDHLGQVLPIAAIEGLGGWDAPLLTYLELPLVALLGATPLAGRLVAALAGALLAPLCYVLALRLQIPRAAAALAGLFAAAAPWLIGLGRVAAPQALAPALWVLALLAALRFVGYAGRASASGLALAAGVAVYADRSLRLALPLLVLVALLLARLRYGRGWFARCWPALALLALLWLPFGYAVLANPAIDLRMNAEPSRLAAWWQAYGALLRAPGGPATGIGGRADALGGYPPVASAAVPLLLLGLGLFALRLALGLRRAPGPLAPRPAVPAGWWLLAGALLIAPLPAGAALPAGSPPAVLLVPLLALLVGAGAAALLSAIGRGIGPRWRQPAQRGLTLALSALICWPMAGWLLRPAAGLAPATPNYDALIDACARAAGYAAQFDEVWFDTDAIDTPSIYLLAALPPAEAQAQIVVERRPGQPSIVARVGKFRFSSLADAPRILPLLEAIPGQLGQPGFVLQRWDRAGRRVLVVRRM